MSADAYLRQLLGKYTANAAAAKAAAQTVYPTIEAWANVYLLGAEFSGSIAKGTAVSLGTDADIFVSVSSAAPGTLAHMYQTLHNALINAGYQPTQQNVSLGLHVNGYAIDVVPGRRQAQQGDDHSLYRSKAKAWTQTNVRKHVNFVTQSGRLEEIRVIKIWRQLHGLAFPSFFLELAVIDALKSARQGNLATNVWSALTHVRDCIRVVRYVDPANSNNVVSDDATAVEKSAIAAAARNSLQQSQWKGIIW